MKTFPSIVQRKQSEDSLWFTGVRRVIIACGYVTTLTRVCLSHTPNYGLGTTFPTEKVSVTTEHKLKIILYPKKKKKKDN